VALGVLEKFSLTGVGGIFKFQHKMKSNLVSFYVRRKLIELSSVQD